MSAAPDVWRRARERGDVLRSGPNVLLLSHREVKAALRDPDGFSNRGHYEGSQAEAVQARLTEAQLVAYREGAAFESQFGVSHADRELIHGWSSAIGRNRGAWTPTR